MLALCALLGWLARLARLNTRNTPTASFGWVSGVQLTCSHLAWLDLAWHVLNLLDLLLASLGFILLRFACLACLICMVWLPVLLLIVLAFLFTLLCLLAYFALLCLLGLLCYATVCDAWLGRFHLARLGFSPLGLVWLDRLARWHAHAFQPCRRCNTLGASAQSRDRNLEIGIEFWKLGVRIAKVVW